MSEITGDFIVSAIATKIKNSFTPAPKIYKEQVDQGLVKPCFFIGYVKQGQQQIAKNWYQRQAMMVIRFHPTESTNKYSQCRAVGEQLLDVLTSIDLPTELDGYETLPCLGKDLEFKIRDEVLIFYVTYEHKVKKVVTPETMMATIGLDIELK